VSTRAPERQSSSVREALVPRTVGGSVAMPPLVPAGVAARRPVDASRGSSVIWEVLAGFGGLVEVRYATYQRYCSHLARLSKLQVLDKDWKD